MLPSLTLAAGRGYTATDLGSLFTGPSIFWTVAGSATQPLFDGFNLLHLERAAVALQQVQPTTLPPPVAHPSGASKEFCDSCSSLTIATIFSITAYRQFTVLG